MSSDNNGKILIRTGWLIDGSGRPFQKNAGIVVENGIIQDVVDVYPGSDRFQCVADFTGCTVIPGLIDGHTHLFMAGVTLRETRDRQLAAGFEAACGTIFGNLRDHLKYGVLAVRDGGDRNGFVLRYKTESGKTGRIHQTPVTISAAGWAWHARGRYGRMIGRPPEEDQTLAEAITKGSRSVDHVKIVNSGLNSLLRYGKQTPPQFDLEELTDAVAAARILGLKVMVHANGEVPVRIAVEAGCDSIEHGYFMGEDNLKRMAERQVYWLPTVCPIKAHADSLNPDARGYDVCMKTLDHQLEQLRLAREYGVRVSIGTDAGSIGVHHGRSIWEEMGLLMTAGYPVEAAIRCATAEGAAVLGTDRLGLLHKGRPATFVVVGQAPEQFSSGAPDIRAVCINGAFV